MINNFQLQLDKASNLSLATGVVLSGCRAGLFTYIYTKVGKLSLLMSMCPNGSGESYDK